MVRQRESVLFLWRSFALWALEYSSFCSYLLITEIILCYSIFCAFTYYTGLSGSLCFIFFSSNFVHNVIITINVVNCGSRKITVCSNSATQKCYSTAIARTSQYFVLNSISRENRDLFLFRYAIVPLFNNTDHQWS
jgi:hypothetical protein